MLTLTKHSPRFTRQSVFDFVARSIIAQGGASGESDGGCLYRGPSGRKCAAGHMIPDADYHIDLEGASANQYKLIEASPLYGEALKATGPRFMVELQEAHDESHQLSRKDAAFLATWRNRMVNLASQYGLSPAAVQ